MCVNMAVKASDGVNISVRCMPCSRRGRGPVCFQIKLAGYAPYILVAIKPSDAATL